jgi:hypothetical protein
MKLTEMALHPEFFVHFSMPEERGLGHNSVFRALAQVWVSLSLQSSALEAVKTATGVGSQEWVKVAGEGTLWDPRHSISNKANQIESERDVKLSRWIENPALRDALRVKPSPLPPGEGENLFKVRSFLELSARGMVSPELMIPLLGDLSLGSLSESEKSYLEYLFNRSYILQNLKMWHGVELINKKTLKREIFVYDPKMSHLTQDQWILTSFNYPPRHKDFHKKMEFLAEKLKLTLKVPPSNYAESKSANY